MDTVVIVVASIGILAMFAYMIVQFSGDSKKVTKH